jgi:hypothetical protein
MYNLNNATKRFKEGDIVCGSANNFLYYWYDKLFFRYEKEHKHITSVILMIEGVNVKVYVCCHPQIINILLETLYFKALNAFMPKYEEKKVHKPKLRSNMFNFF